MAAAYAALVSLLNTLDHFQIHPLLSTSLDNYTNQSLREKIDSFLDFVEKYSDEDLVRRIGVVAHMAEDIIEAHAAHRISAPASTRKRLIISRNKKKAVAQTFLSTLQEIIDEMDSIKEEIIMIQEESGSSSSAPPPTPMVDNSSEADDLLRRMAVVALDAGQTIQQSPSLLPDKHSTKEDMDSIKKTGPINQQPAYSSPSSAMTTKMVGFDGYLEQLLDQLTRQHSGSRQILPIVGMGGIGKTTLARNVYDNALIMEHFYVRAWVNVSQEFSVRGILLQALSCLGGSTSKTNKTDDELEEEMYKTLFGERYLIVLDDVWSVEAWEKIMFSFPENNNGSRIVITTRQIELVDYFGSSSLAVGFLDDKKSWELFCEKTFPQQDCPSELVGIGKRIVVKCKGLPLGIVVVGGFLKKSPRTLEYWEEIEKDKSLILDSGDGKNASDILYLSYKHLPVWLKSCFLYLGLFPEDYHIRVSQLIKLWVAEGFIKSNKNQSLEEVAENYLKELVDRNLVLVGQLSSDKKLKTCLVHDLVRDLCLRIVEKEKFVCVQRYIDGERHFIVDERRVRYHGRESHRPSLVHPLILDGQRAEPSNSRLLRVLFSDDKLTLDPFREVNLLLIHATSSYSAFDVYKIPSLVSRLWSLQTIIVTQYVTSTAPCEIWEMPQLRHINISWEVHLPPPPPRSNDMIVLQNLQTLATVVDLMLTEEVCKRIPNIKKLGLYNANAQGEEASYHLRNVGCFNKLESLQCSSNGYDIFRRNLKFPSSLKKLTLKSCKLLWSDMAMIASLPHLQVLKLIYNAVVGAEWNCDEEEFPSLKYLKILDCNDLTNWTSASSSFPVLETLYLNSLTKLQVIPQGIGDVPTLERIVLCACSYSSVFSAVKIREEQESVGNMDLQLCIGLSGKSEAEKLWEEIQELDITRQNLYIFHHPSYKVY